MSLRNALVLLLVTTLLAGVTSRRSLSITRHPHTFRPYASAEEAHRLQKDLSGSRMRAGHAVPLAGGLLVIGTYYTNITVGTPPVTYNVLLDTGSSNLAIPDANCDSCGHGTNYSTKDSSTSSPIPFDSAECRNCNPSGAGATDQCLYAQPYPSLNDATLCGQGISYGGQSSFITGYIVEDVVNFGGYPVKTGLMPITRQIPAGSFSGSSVIDGILGVASENNAVNPSYVPTVFSNIVKQHGVDNLFGLCLTNSNGGVMDLGFSDSTKYTGEIAWVPQSVDHWYNMQMLDIAVGGTSVGLPPPAFTYLNDMIGTFIDSGTGSILLGPIIWTAFVTTYQAKYSSLPGVSGDSNIFNGYCIPDSVMGGNISIYPKLTFSMQGQSGTVVPLSVPPTSYFLHAGGQYCLGMASVSGIAAVLGDPFMEPFYIVHDKANMRLGFAPLADGACTA